MDKRWTIHSKERLYQGFFNMFRFKYSHSLFAGGESSVIEREVLLRGDAVAVLIWDPEIDRFLFVEQLRPGAFETEGGPWVTEIVAGMVGEGEELEQVVRRESVEEANIVLADVVPMLHFMPSPGGTDERVWLYLARADLRDAGGLHGLAEEGEDIRAFTLPTDSALDMISDGKIDNSMTIIALQWWQLNRHTLGWENA